MESKQTFTANGVSFDMILVEGGTFMMGSTAEELEEQMEEGYIDEEEYDDGWYDVEKPAHKVTLSSYYIGKAEVTQELWVAVMGGNPSDYEGDNLPMEEVSWDDCQEFIRKLNQMTGKHFRLPTEAEWEYAARGGNRSKGYVYSGSNDIDEVAWYDDNSDDETHPVGSKQPNELGLYDMSGNVCEWCADWYGGYSIQAQTNPTGPEGGSCRVVRGGDWFIGDAWLCRSSSRDRYPPNDRDYGLGLRLALSEW